MPAMREAPGSDRRRLTAAALSSLDHLLESPLLAAGQINLISLDAIAERLETRWESRRPLIYLYTERVLEQHVGNRGQFFRVSETDYLVVLPEVRKFAAQALCLRCLREALTHFLGEARPFDLRVREVCAITKGGLDAMPVDPAAVAVGAAEEELRATETDAASGSVDRWTPFVASNGRTVRVSCALEPVFELKGYARIGYRIARRVLATATEQPLTAIEVQNLARSDIEKIDCATVARGLHRLQTEANDQRQLSLIIPVSYVTIANRHGRSALAALFSEAKTFVQAGVICEVCDIEGVPQAALAMATSLINPFCMHVVGHLGGAPGRALGNLQNAGLKAISFDAPKEALGEAEFLGWAKAAVGAAKPIARSVMIYRLGSPRHAAMAALLGASHASLV